MLRAVRNEGLTQNIGAESGSGSGEGRGRWVFDVEGPPGCHGLTGEKRAGDGGEVGRGRRATGSARAPAA